MSDIATQAPAGWYPDVQAHGYERWWNGTEWTAFYREAYPQHAGDVTQTVIVHQPGKRVNHLLHLVLTLLTGGLWLPVWIIVSMAKA